MTDRRSLQTNNARVSRALQFVPGHVGGRVASAQPVRRLGGTLRTPSVGTMAEPSVPLGTPPDALDSARTIFTSTVSGENGSTTYQGWDGTPAAGDMLLSLLVGSWTDGFNSAAEVTPPAGWDVLLSGSHSSGGTNTVWTLIGIDAFSTADRYWTASGFVDGGPLDSVAVESWKISGADAMHWQEPLVTVGYGTLTHEGPDTFDSWVWEGSADWEAPDLSWTVQGQFIAVAGMVAEPVGTLTTPQAWKVNGTVYSAGIAGRPGATGSHTASRWLPGESDGTPASGAVAFEGNVANWQMAGWSDEPAPVMVSIAVGAK